MKRLGRNERIGAAVLAALAFAGVCTVFMVRRCGTAHAPVPSAPCVEVITGPDTPAVSADSHPARADKKKDSAAGGKKRRRKRAGASSAGKTGAQPAAPRNFLDEPVPVRGCTAED